MDVVEAPTRPCSLGLATPADAWHAGTFTTGITLLEGALQPLFTDEGTLLCQCRFLRDAS